MTEPQPGFYSHYKNPDKLYFVLGCATNRTTGEREVVYLACYENDQRLHTRHVDNWNTDVVLLRTDGAIKTIPSEVPRFTRVPTPDNFWTDYLGDALSQVMGEFLL